VRTASEILRFFADWSIDEDAHVYLNFHARRYEFLLNRLEEAALRLRGEATPALRILDVGTSWQTVLISHMFPEAEISTMGFEDTRFPGLKARRHFELDLNQAKWEDSPIPAVKHDIVLLAEVIEHLHTPPARVLRFLRGWLRPGGYMLLQTPNPVALGKRVAMLRGVNPFEIIREQHTNPGHFCEYTVDDIKSVSLEAGLEPIAFWLVNYFGGRTVRSRIYDILCRVLPGELENGITALLREPERTSEP
jgi:SAM-dependent methyltransferase